MTDMRKRRSLGLARRFTLYGLVFFCVVSVIYFIGLVFIVTTAENKLMSSSMNGRIDEILTYDLPFGVPPRLDQLSRFYIEGDPVYAPPPEFLDLKEGFSEEVAGKDLHVFRKTVNGKSYFLARNQDEYESWEISMYITVAIFFAVQCVIFYFFFRTSGHLFIKPMDRLIRETQTLESELMSGKLSAMADYKGDWPENEIGELARSLDSLTERLRTVLQNERGFIAEVCHELKTPLTIVSLSSEMLLLNEGLSEKAKLQAERINNAAGRMKGIIETFLGTITHEEKILTTDLIGFREYCESKLPDWQELAKNKTPPLKISVDWENANDQKYNRYLVEAVINNLVKNAINYTFEGEVKVTFSPNSIQIADTGIGISEEERERIFDLGYRGGGNKIATGFGVGLTVAKRICDSLGWQISLTSRANEGTQITITLPK